jgi:nitrogen fixation/metabolism regulation signal transduction histidine kinase
MTSNRWAWQLVLRLLLLSLSASAALYLVMLGQYPASAAVLALVAALQFYLLLKQLHKTNQELTRFMYSLHYADFSQRFDFSGQAHGFAVLGEALCHIQQRFANQRDEQMLRTQQMEALLEHVPVPLLTISPEGVVALRNNAARRLFHAQVPTNAADFHQYSEQFARAIEAMRPGQRALLNCSIDGVSKRLSVMLSEISSTEGTERLLSLQDIQLELDDVQQQAWQDLVRVLTHEIMNSITPLASLAKTSAYLLKETRDELALNDSIPSQTRDNLCESLSDIDEAVATIERRSDGLMQFVQSYRRLNQLQAPRKKQFTLSELFADVERLTQKALNEAAIQLDSEIKPHDLALYADAEMLQQLLLNLLQNAQQALTEAETLDPHIRLLAYSNRSGRTLIEISDNGPGIDDAIIDSVFVPFFTTRREGSGVGLALTRQIMLSHDGAVTISRNEEGGTLVRLIF